MIESFATLNDISFHNFFHFPPPLSIDDVNTKCTLKTANFHHVITFVDWISIVLYVFVVNYGEYLPYLKLVINYVQTVDSLNPYRGIQISLKSNRITNSENFNKRLVKCCAYTHACIRRTNVSDAWERTDAWFILRTANSTLLFRFQLSFSSLRLSVLLYFRRKRYYALGYNIIFDNKIQHPESCPYYILHSIIINGNALRCGHIQTARR